MKQILYIDMDNVLVDFPSAFPRLDDGVLAEFEDRMAATTARTWCGCPAPGGSNTGCPTAR